LIEPVAVCLLIPRNAGFWLRTTVLRGFGWNLDRSARFASVPKFSGSGKVKKRLEVGPRVWVNVGCHFELNDRVVIDENAAIGHDVLILTSTHSVGGKHARAGDLTIAAVCVGKGAWIGARSVILPGVTVGPGAIVSAGSVVGADVPENAVVAGAPAKVVVPRLPG